MNFEKRRVESVLSLFQWLTVIWKRSWSQTKQTFTFSQCDIISRSKQHIELAIFHKFHSFVCTSYLCSFYFYKNWTKGSRNIYWDHFSTANRLHNKVFSCDAALQVLIYVCLCVCLSVCGLVDLQYTNLRPFDHLSLMYSGLSGG